MPYVTMAETSDIPERHGMYVDRGGRAVAIFNAGAGRFYACNPVCPHEEGPLADGWIEGSAVVCPWHGFDFDLTTGRCLVDPALSISVYPVRVVGTTIEVDVG